MASSFSSLYRAWIDARFDKDPGRRKLIERQLVDVYRRAWVSGDGADREAILHFLMLRKEASGFDLVVQGLRSGDRSLASTAAAVASALIFWRFDLGRTIRRDLEEFGKRFPEWGAISWAALEALDARENLGQ